MITILLKFVAKFAVNNKSALVCVMIWCWTGDELLLEAVMALLTDEGIIMGMGSANERRGYTVTSSSLAEPIPRMIPALSLNVSCCAIN